MSNVETEIENIKKELADLKAKSDETKRDEDRARYAEFRKKYYKYVDITDEDLDDPTEQPPIPEQDGRPQPHKGGNKDPNTWKVVPMKDDPSLFKIVDDKNINIADMFHKKTNAEDYVEKAKSGTLPPAIPKPPVVTPTPQPTPGGPLFDENTGPYTPTSPPMGASQRGPTERHYASGKPSDWTIEKNVKEIEFDNYQWVTFQTINQMAHDDTCSHKLGGTHMGSGWFDHSVGIYDGKTGLGNEPDHPSTNLFIIKGPKIGDIRNKKIGIATTYFKKTNHTELWTNVGDGWKKQCEGTDVGGFNPKSAINEAQLRIDGFKTKNTPPTLHSAFVTEIAGP